MSKPAIFIAGIIQIAGIITIGAFVTHHLLPPTTINPSRNVASTTSVAADKSQASTTPVDHTSLVSTFINPTTTAAKTAMSTYTNMKYGLTISISSDLAMVIAPKYSIHWPDNIGDSYDAQTYFANIVEFTKTSGKTFVQFDQGIGTTTYTSFITAGLTISIATSSAALASCLRPYLPGLQLTNPTSTTINGVQFKSIDATLLADSLNGKSFGGRFLRTIANNACYSIELSDYGQQFQTAPGVDQGTSEEEAMRYGFIFSAWDAFVELNNLSHSFSFIAPA